MNVKVRPACREDAHAIAQIHVASWQDTYAGILDSGFLAKMSVMRGVRHWQAIIAAYEMGIEARRVLVAQDDTETVLGFSYLGALRDEGAPENYGEIDALYVAADYRGLGFGRQLVEASFDLFAAQSYPTARIWVLTANPARFFYEAIGGAYAAERTVKIAGGTHREFAYDFRL